MLGPLRARFLCLLHLPGRLSVLSGHSASGGGCERHLDVDLVQQSNTLVQTTMAGARFMSHMLCGDRPSKERSSLSVSTITLRLAVPRTPSPGHAQDVDRTGASAALRVKTVDPQARVVLSLIDEQPGVHVSALALAVSLCTSRLRSLFRRTMRISLSKHVKRRRLSRAQELSRPRSYRSKRWLPSQGWVMSAISSATSVPISERRRLCTVERTSANQ